MAALDPQHVGTYFIELALEPKNLAVALDAPATHDCLVQLLFQAAKHGDKNINVLVVVRKLRIDGIVVTNAAVAV
jgi:hypothetical protein